MKKKTQMSGSVENLIGMKKNSKKTSDVQSAMDTSHWVQYNQRPEIAEAAVAAEDVHVHFADDLKAKDDDACSDASSSTDSPIAMDGGYGWFIVFVSFSLHFVCDGISFCSSYIYQGLQKSLNANRFQASFVTGLFLSVPLLFSPISGVLTDIYDCRKVTIFGSALCVCSFVVAAFCGNLWIFSIVFGVVGAFGLCCNYNTAITMVSYYFEKKRGIATGIATTGTGIGTTVVARLLQFTMSYGFEVGILTCAALNGICLVLGFLVKDVQWKSDTTAAKQRKFERAIKKGQQQQETTEDENVVKERRHTQVRRAFSVPIMVDQLGRLLDPAISTHSIAGIQDNVARSASVSTFRRKAAVLPDHPDYSMMYSSHLDHLNLEIGKSPTTTTTSRNRKRVTSKTSHSFEALDLAVAESSSEESSTSSSSPDVSEQSNDGDSSSSEISELPKQKEGVRFEKDLNGNASVNLEGSLAVPTHPPANGMYHTSSRLLTRASIKAPEIALSRVPAFNACRVRYMPRSNLTRMHDRGLSEPTLFYKQKKKRGGYKHKEEAIESLASLGRAIKNPFYILFLVHCFILYALYDMAYVQFVEFVSLEVDANVPTSHILNVLGLSNVFGMIFYGLLADRKYFKYERVYILYGTAIIMAGLSTMAMSFVRTYVQILVVAALYGFFIAANFVMSSLFVIHIISVSDFQGGYSAQSLFSGVGNLIGPPIIGYIRDTVGSYFWILIGGGVAISLSGFIVCVMYCECVLSLRPDDTIVEREDEEEEEQEEEQKQKKPSILSPRILVKKDVAENSDGKALLDSP